MRKVSIVAVALSSMIGLTAVVPAQSMPLPSPTFTRSSDVQEARVVVKYGYYRGHRGYRSRRAGYRYYNGFWYPSAAFIAPRIVIGPRARWCGPRWRRHRC